jgi:hypothetical protein
MLHWYVCYFNHWCHFVVISNFGLFSSFGTFSPCAKMSEVTSVIKGPHMASSATRAIELHTLFNFYELFDLIQGVGDAVLS